MEKPEIVNNMQGKPYEHYTALYRRLDPREIAARCGLVWDEAAGELELTFLGNRYRAAWPDFSVRLVEQRVPADQLAALGKGLLLLLRFLTEGRSVPAAGRFYTYSEMPWGDVYIRQFTGRCINRLAFTYGSRVGDFCAVMEAMGAEKLPNGDAGYALEVLPGFTLRLLLWEADEDFPPSAQILFSDNFPLSFAAEDLAVVGDVVLSAMKQAGR